MTETEDPGLDPKDWRQELDDRQQKEVALAQLYVGSFNHGTSGHLGYQTLAKMAQLLDREKGGA